MYQRLSTCPFQTPVFLSTSADDNFCINLGHPYQHFQPNSTPFSIFPKQASTPSSLPSALTESKFYFNYDNALHYSSTSRSSHRSGLVRKVVKLRGKATTCPIVSREVDADIFVDPLHFQCTGKLLILPDSA